MSNRSKLFRLPWRSRRQIRDDVDTELAFHLDMRADALVAAGYAADSARERALHEFGDLDDARRYIGALDAATEAAQRRSDLMSDLRQDLTYAMRTMRSAPGFAAAVIATLALGIGATTAIFSIVNGVLLEPLAYPHPDRIVRLYQITERGTRNSVSQPNFYDWATRTRSFSAMALWGSTSSDAVQTPSGPVVAHVATVTRQFFEVLGVQPETGRLFTSDETRFGGPRAALISDSFWRAQFGASPSALGQIIRQGNDSYEVVGVMPASAVYPAENEIWLPLELWPVDHSRTSQGYGVIARLKPGVTLDAARQDLSAVSRELKGEYGNETSMSDATFIGLREQMVGSVRLRLYLLLAASGFLLLIGLANAINLLMARLSLRQGEIAVRMALGASAWRVTRQVLAESAVLVTSAALVGLLFAVAGVRLVVGASAGMLPRASDVRLDWPVLAFSVGIAVVLSTALGLLSAWRSASHDMREALSASPRAMSGPVSSGRLRRGMVVAQIALTVVLLVGAALIGRGFLRLLDVDPGFTTQHLVVVRASPVMDDKVQQLVYYNTLIDRVRALPGVVAAGTSSGVPIVGGGADGGYLLLDDPRQTVTWDAWNAFPASRKGHAEFRIVDGDYFAAMGMHLLQGRLFQATDTRDGSHAGVVSALFAKQAWPGQNPIGKVVQYGNMDADLHPFTVVGVVSDVRDDGLADVPPPIFYGYLPQRINVYAQTLVVRTARDPISVIGSIRRIVHDLRPDVPVQARTIDRVIADSVADRRFTLFVIAAFAGAALLLASLGVYSVVSYLVTQRTREIGVRVALGAQRGDVLRLVVGEGLRLAIVGIGVGAAGSLLLTKLLRGLVYGVSTTDPVAFASVLILLTVVASVAAYLPARRAARVDPIQVLRSA